MSTPKKQYPSSPDAAVVIQPPSPRHPPPGTPTAGAQRKIGIAVDLSEESAYAVRWAVQNYLRPGDAVILVHVSPTDVLYGADWGSIDLSVGDDDGEAGEECQKRRLEDEYYAFTTAKANDLAQPLVDAQVPFKIHIVKDHDMKERLCLEVERLGLSAVVLGSRGFGAVARKNAKGRLGSVSDYCVHHCVCPVIVVRDKDKNGGGGSKMGSPASRGGRYGAGPAVPEEDLEYHDACDKQSEMDKAA